MNTFKDSCHVHCSGQGQLTDAEAAEVQGMLTEP